MWTSTIERSPRRVWFTRLLGRFWRGAYFSSFAPLQVQNVPRQPLPEQNWVRVRNRLAGISGSDLQFVAGEGEFGTALAALPGGTLSYPGREVVGEVVEVGEDVRHVQVGDRVALEYGANCVSQGVQPLCRACAEGDFNLCEKGAFSGQEPIGGGWSEEMLLHESQLFRVPRVLSDEQAAMLEPTAVALHAVLRRIPRAGEHVLIVGAGTVGLLVLQVVRTLAPGVTVSVMARHAFQVEQATRLGAAHILYPQDSYNGVQQATGAQLFKGRFGNTMLLGGYDVVFDTIGTRRTLQDALRWTRAGGALVLVGRNPHVMRVDLTPVWYQEVSLIGSMGHGTETWPFGSPERRSTFEAAAELIERGYLTPEKLITHRFALTDFPVALTTAADKGQTRSIKVVFDYALLPATVVPNVRANANARRRRPLRVSPPPVEEMQEQEQEPTVQPVAQPQQPQQPQQQPPLEEGWESPSTPMGGTWMHYVQPLPQSDAPAEDETSKAVVHEMNAANVADEENEVFFPYATDDEGIPPHLLALTGSAEAGETGETAEAGGTIGAEETRQVITEDHRVTEDHAMLPDEMDMPVEQFSLTEETRETGETWETGEPAAFALHEPQPILMPTFAGADVAREAEEAEEAGDMGASEEMAQGDEETKTFIPPRSSRSRGKSAARKATGQVRATNEAGDTSLE